MSTKVCRICRQEKSVELFRIRNKKTGNRRKECNKCQISYQKEWYNKHPEKIEQRKEYQKEWCKTNRDKRLEYSKRNRNKPGQREWYKKWRTENREHLNELARIRNAKKRASRPLSNKHRNKDRIIKEYQDYVKVSEIAKNVGLSTSCVFRSLKMWGIKRPPKTKQKETQASRPRGWWRKGKTTYSIWLEKYGKEEADRRDMEFRKLRSEQSRGKGNSMYGKAAPLTSGSRGGTGWYKGHFFRSLRELTFMLKLDRENIEWSSAEHISIPYKCDGIDYTYHPDFLVGNTIVEIKPKREMKYRKVLAKESFAKAFCASLNLCYQMIDIQPDIDKIYRLYINGTVTFTKKYEDEFLDRCTHDGRLIMY